MFYYIGFNGTRQTEFTRIPYRPSSTVIVFDNRMTPAFGGLSGTVYAGFDPKLQAALATKFPKGNHATLVDALNELSNEVVAILARIGSRIGAYDPDLWNFITSIPTSGWITDNWGMTVKLDASGMIAHLSGSPKWCKDDADSAKRWHNTTGCWRE